MFVFVPHVPAFSPVAMSSSFKSDEYVDAIFYPFFYAAVVILVQVTGVPVSTLFHAIIITLTTELVYTTPVTLSSVPEPVTSVGLPTACVAATPVTEYVEIGVIDPTALVTDTPLTAIKLSKETVAVPTEVVALTPVASAIVQGAIITVPILLVMDNP